MSQPASRCRSCGAHIRWAVTEKGRRIPLDLQPSSEGNIEIRNNAFGQPRAVVTGKGDDENRKFISHFATCPNSSAHRRQRRSTPTGG